MAERYLWRWGGLLLGLGFWLVLLVRLKSQLSLEPLEDLAPARLAADTFAADRADVAAAATSAVADADADASVDEAQAEAAICAVGMPGLAMLAMGLELEMQPKAGGEVDFERGTELTREALAQQTCRDCGAEREAELQSLEAWKSEKILKTAKPHWTLHKETDPGPLYELVSPWLYGEAEMSLAVAATDRLSVDFGPGKYAALHIHVDGRCLLNSAPRVAALWLLWETFHGSLTQVLAKRSSVRTYGPSLGAKHPELLAAVQDFWTSATDAGVAAESASVASFTELLETMHDGMFQHAKAGLLAGLPHRDGYRNFAVNLCHLLEIRCCKACDKNDAPKHGLVEFRIFDVAYGPKLCILLELVQRMVQRVCADYAGVEPLLLVHGREPATNTSALLSLLEMDASAFRENFPEPTTRAPRVPRESPARRRRSE